MSIILKKHFEKQSKHFGLLLSIFFFILAVYLIFNKSIFLGQFLLILSGTFFLVSIAIPKSLSRITKLWLRFMVAYQELNQNQKNKVCISVIEPLSSYKFASLDDIFYVNDPTSHLKSEYQIIQFPRELARSLSSCAQ
jgi:hypothetical protein